MAESSGWKHYPLASKFEWHAITCEVESTLDKVERNLQFTGAVVRATLTINDDTERERAERLLQKAEGSCLIRNSLKADVRLRTEIITAQKL